ncbi:hypothetical protein [Lactiplantibacillus mudanjiangensis]|uniref:hypothetical protein n=1 Tax=Lactiplantibacillus mudanjiangensis TaxID=1296538 RepID=UPI0010313AF3|nr:hypothetical protein [Lactiplantibacillus mudanjiangensis]
MYDQLAQPLTVRVPTGNQTRDKRGLPIEGFQPDKLVNEPLVSNADPNLTYHNAGGGQISVGTLYWESRTAGYPLGTLVITKPGQTYKVISHGLDVAANLTYYQVQGVGQDE